MSDAIQIAKEYKLTNKAIEVFRKDFITIQLFMIFLATPFISYQAAIFFDSAGHSAFIWGTFLALAVCSTGAFLAIIFQIFSGDEMPLTLSKSRFYHNQFTPDEQAWLSSLLGKSFKQIIKDEKPKIRKPLIEHLGELEKTLYDKEYLQSLKNAIEGNPENEAYLPTLKKLVKNYNFNLEHHKRKFKDINKELSKAELTTFKENYEQPLKIIEQE